MKATKLKELVKFCIEKRNNILITGQPGCGKSDIVKQACIDMKVKCIISHPVVSDPTDYKGLPAIVEGNAEFLPYGDLRMLLHADEKTVFFIDDLGQASPSVQAACMQLLLAREINGKKISDEITFVSATNRKEDRAAVGGILEPVKSRFKTIINLDVDVEDWCVWAQKEDLPHQLISFIRFKPDMLTSFKPTKDIINTPTPRTVASVGFLQKEGLPNDFYYEVFKGSAGESFATEYTAYLNIFNDLITFEDIIKNPEKVKVPERQDTLYAVSGYIVYYTSIDNFSTVFKFIKRLPPEFQVMIIKGISSKEKEIFKTTEFNQWSINNMDVLL